MVKKVKLIPDPTLDYSGSNQTPRPEYRLDSIEEEAMRIFLFSIQASHENDSIEKVADRLWLEASKQLRDEANDQSIQDSKKGISWPDKVYAVSDSAIWGRYKELVQKYMVEPRIPKKREDGRTIWNDKRVASPFVPYYGRK